jgi:probable serine/threonine-protein kinase roco9
MNKIINKIVALIIILGIILAQTTVFANNVGQDPNNYIEMPMSIKTNRAETITIHNLQNYRMAYQIVETPSENYKKYVAFIDESNSRKEQLTNEKNQLKSVVEAAQAEAEAKYKIYSELNSNIHATSEQREQAKLAFEAAKDVADKALQPYQAKLAEMEAYDRTSEETLKSFIPSYDNNNWLESNGTFTIPSNNNGKERIVTVWVRVVDENANTYYEATMYPFNLGKVGTEAQTKRYTLEINQGREYDLVMENYNPVDFVWTIENPEIIEVANGKIKGNKAGTTNLNGISNDGRTKVAVVVTVREAVQPAQPTQPENNNSGNVNNNTNTENTNNNTNQENPTNNNAENTNKENNNIQPTQPTNNNTENTNNTTPANNNVENTNNRNQSNKPVENTNNTNNNANRPSENTNNNQNTAESTNNHQNTANANNNNTNTKPITPNAVNNNTEVPTNTNNFPNNTTNNATNNTKNTNTNNNSNKAVLKEESKTRNTGSINSGIEKDAPKRLPQTGDIPMSAVITIITAGVIAIGMFIKIYKLRKNN